MKMCVNFGGYFLCIVELLRYIYLFIIIIDVIFKFVFFKFDFFNVFVLLESKEFVLILGNFLVLF